MNSYLLSVVMMESPLSGRSNPRPSSPLTWSKNMSEDIFVTVKNSNSVKHCCDYLSRYMHIMSCELNPSRVTLSFCLPISTMFLACVPFFQLVESPCLKTLLGHFSHSGAPMTKVQSLCMESYSCPRSALEPKSTRVVKLRGSIGKVRCLDVATEDSKSAVARDIPILLDFMITR